MEYKDLQLERKSTRVYELAFSTDGIVEDITGWTTYFTVKAKMEDADADAVIYQKVTDHSDPKNGVTLITLSTTDTDITAGVYYYSIDYLDDESNQAPIMSGKLRVAEPVLKTRS